VHTDDLKRGLPLLAQEEEQRRREWGADSHHLCKISQELANGYQASGDFRNAELVVRRAFESLGQVERDWAACDGELYDRVGTVLTEVGAYADAEAPLTRALEIRRKEFGEGQSTALSASSIAELRLRQGRPDEARVLIGDALRMLEIRPPRSGVPKARMQRRLGAIQLAQGQFADARRSLQEAKSYFAQFPQLVLDISATELDLARLSRREGKLEDAERHLARSESLLRAHDVPGSLRLVRVGLERALLERARNPRSPAKAQLAKVAASYAEAGYPHHPELDGLD
jgi:tetratricopeptide (TPR) repeat protein